MTLEDFVEYWLSESPISPPPDPYERVAENVGVTLYRDNFFQVQLWTCAPNTDIGDHAHPDMDGWAIRVAGDIRFRKHGKPATRRDTQIVMWRGLKTPMIQVYRGESHGLAIGPSGGSFLVIAERVDGQPPTSVHRDWAGAPLDADHAVALGVV